MARTVNYSWRAYSDGGLENPEKQMVAYYTDLAHTPTQWSEDLEEDAKRKALEVIEADRDADEPIDNFKESVINAEDRLVQRTSSRTGNSWEVALDADGWALPDPETDYVPGGGPWTLPDDPPAIPVTTLSNATVKIEKPEFNRLKITIEGNLPEA